MGDEVILAGHVLQEGSTWWVALEDGQRIRIVSSGGLAHGDPVTLVVTTPVRHQQNKQELAHHLLAEILNGS